MKYTIKFTEPVNGKTEVLTDNYQITNLRLQFGKDLKESTPIRNVISVKSNFSKRIGLMALSNNLPILSAELEKLNTKRERIKALKSNLRTAADTFWLLVVIAGTVIGVTAGVIYIFS